jgi:hypothetical protein
VSNRTLLDLSKVQHGTFYYVNQYGNIRSQIPLWSKRTIKGVTSGEAITVRSEIMYEHELAAYHPDYPGETLLERAKRLDITDKWTPVVTFQLTANHNIQFTGTKAFKMWELWQAKIYGKNKK